MSKKNPTVLESFKLAETLLGEIKSQQAKSHPKKEEKKPPKWLLGRETLYRPKETPEEYKKRWMKKLNLTEEEYRRLLISFLL